MTAAEWADVALHLSWLPACFVLALIYVHKVRPHA